LFDGKVAQQALILFAMGAKLRTETAMASSPNRTAAIDVKAILTRLMQNL